jgi:choline dehydrogenase-like flavoprotein
MSAVDSDEVRTEALFVSDVQRSQEPSPELIRQTITTTVDRLGETGCAELVAQEFGEHPDCALGRMQWARTQVRQAFRNAA